MAVAACLLVGLATGAYAQDQPEPEPTGGYDPGTGFFIQDTAAEFRLNIGAYAQVRYSMNWRQDTADSVENFERGYSVPRAEMYLFGSYTDRFDYYFRALMDDGGKFSLPVAYVQYSFSDEWNLTVGKQFIPLSREDWQYAPDIMAMDFSANDNTFAVGTSLGLVLQGITSDRLRFWLGASNGAFTAKGGYPLVEESEVLLNGRFEFQLAGSDWSVWNDLIGRRGRPFGVLVGFAPGYLIRAGNDVEFRSESQVNLDVSINGNGYQALIAGSWTSRSPVGGDRFNNYGLYAQGGYFITDIWQPYVRYDYVSPGDQPGDLESFNAASAGLNWIPFQRTNQWKISVEAGYLFSALSSTIVSPSGSLGWLASDDRGQTLLRFQAQFGF